MQRVRVHRGVIAPTIDAVDSLASAGGILPDQWWQQSTEVNTPEKRLMFAVLEESMQQIDCACRDLATVGRLRRPTTSRYVAYDARTLSDVLSWVMSSGYAKSDEDGWGFDDVCDAVGIDRSYLLGCVWRLLRDATQKAEAIRANGSKRDGETRSRRRRIRK